jgi:hypothetical protein
MDFMFEDEVDEVGSDVEAYCPKCKGDTTHVVISKYEDEIRRVQCNPCGDVHSYRKPRGDVEDDVPEPIAAKKRAMMKKLSWEEFFAKHDQKAAKPYEFREHYVENVIVTHPKFGKGFVSEVLSDSKVELTFKDSRRVLVHNRRDMPGLPLAAEGDGHPSNAKLPKAAAPAKGKAIKDVKDVKEAAAPGKNGPAAAAKEPVQEKHEKQEKPEKKDAKEAAKAAAPAPAPAPAAKARTKVPVKTSPAAKAGVAAAKRTAKPARAVNDASGKRTAKSVKPAPKPKAAKKGKK